MSSLSYLSTLFGATRRKSNKNTITNPVPRHSRFKSLSSGSNLGNPLTQIGDGSSLSSNDSKKDAVEISSANSTTSSTTPSKFLPNHHNDLNPSIAPNSRQAKQSLSPASNSVTTNSPSTKTTTTNNSSTGYTPVHRRKQPCFKQPNSLPSQSKESITNNASLTPNQKLHAYLNKKKRSVSRITPSPKKKYYGDSIDYSNASECSPLANNPYFALANHVTNRSFNKIVEDDEHSEEECEEEEEDIDLQSDLMLRKSRPSNAPKKFRGQRGYAMARSPKKSNIKKGRSYSSNESNDDLDSDDDEVDVVEVVKDDGIVYEPNDFHTFVDVDEDVDDDDDDDNDYVNNSAYAGGDVTGETIKLNRFVFGSGLGDDGMPNAQEDGPSNIEEDPTVPPMYNWNDRPNRFEANTSNRSFHRSNITVSEPKLNVKYQHIPKYKLRQDQAIKNTKYFVFECMNPDVISTSPNSCLSDKPLQSKGIDHVRLFLRKDQGAYCIRGFQKNLHYEIHEHELQHFLHLCEEKGIRVVMMEDDVTFNDVGSQGVLKNGIDAGAFIHQLNTMELIQDYLVVLDTATGFYKIPIKLARGNRSGPFGVNGDQNVTKLDRNTNVNAPSFITGTTRYSPLFGILTQLTLLLQREGSFVFGYEHFSEARKNQFARAIDPKNIGEMMGIYLMVHDYHTSPDYYDLLQPHRDVCNDPTCDWTTGVWETHFLPQLGRYVTVVFTFTWRNSCKNWYDRLTKVSEAASIIMQKYEEQPLHTRTVNNDSFLPDNFPHECQVIQTHFDQLHDLSPGIHAIEEMNRLYKSIFKDKLLPTHVVDEMLYTFGITNNRLRFHEFMKQVFDSMSEHTEEYFSTSQHVPIPVAAWIHIMKKHNSLDGSKLNGANHGVARYQSNSTNPQLLMNVCLSLRKLHDILNEIGMKPVTTSDEYQKYLKKVEEGLLGYGVLKSQKILYLAAASGRITNTILNYACNGSLKQHFTRMKEEPYCLKHADQVKQTLRNLMTRNDWNGSDLPPAKAEEMICCLTAEKLPSKSIVIKGIPLFEHCMVDKQSRVYRHDPITKVRQIFHPPRYEHDFNNMMPKWLDTNGYALFCGVQTLIPTMENYNYIKDVKKKESRAKKKESPGIITTYKNIMNIGHVQKMMNLGDYFILRDGVCFVADWLQCQARELSNMIQIRRTGGGHMPHIPASFLKPYCTKQTIFSIENCPKERRPILGLLENSPVWCYKDPIYAKMAMVIHLLTNSFFNRKPWFLDLLEEKKEIVLILPPFYKERALTMFFGLLYSHNSKVYFRPVNDVTHLIGMPIRIGHINDGKEYNNDDMSYLD